MTNFKNFCKALEEKIKQSFNEGVTLPEAEKLAGEFLHAQLIVSSELTKADLDSRLRKTGVKSIRAAIYLDIVRQADKKPTEMQLTSMLDSDKIVLSEQEAFDTAEVQRDELERYYSIFQNAHIHYRSVAKGRFE